MATSWKPAISCKPVADTPEMCCVSPWRSALVKDTPEVLTAISRKRVANTSDVWGFLKTGSGIPKFPKDCRLHFSNPLGLCEDLVSLDPPDQEELVGGDIFKYTPH